MERLITLTIALVCFIIVLLLWINAPNIAMPPSRLYDITTTTLLINWYDSERELQRATGDSGIVGLSNCEMRPEFNVSFCELWLVRPRSQNDSYTYDTIGHELYHALTGGFHSAD